MQKKERWELKSVPTETKKKIVRLGKEKGYDFANDFVIEVLNLYLEDEKFSNKKKYFEQRWQEVIDSNQFLTDAFNRNLEISVRQRKEFQKTYDEIRVQIEILSTIQQMYIGYNIEDSMKFAKLYKKYFNEELPNIEELNSQQRLEEIENDDWDL